MTPEQHSRLRAVSISHFSAALSRAIPLIGQAEADVRAGLWPLWRTALHDILVEVGACPCASGQPDCVATWSDQRLAAAFPDGHSMGFAVLEESFHASVAAAGMALATFSGEDPQ